MRPLIGKHKKNTYKIYITKLSQNEKPNISFQMFSLLVLNKSVNKLNKNDYLIKIYKDDKAI